MSEILAEFKEEHSGMLNWLLEGCLAWQKEGLIEPESVRRDTMDYRSEEDILQQFVDAECTMGDGLTADKEEVLKRVNIFLSGLREDAQYSMTKLTRDLAQKGVGVGGSGRKLYTNISLNEREQRVASGIGRKS
jgi:putative DNA primase/helicase